MTTVHCSDPSAPAAGLPALWRRWARLRYPILLRGERGTGKTALAARLHADSGRSGPFVNGSLARMSNGLEVAELMGHCRGAFTTALASREGIFAQAHLGTAFLDEIGRASLEAQGAMLDFLDHRKVKPIGGIREIPLDVRLIAATNADLESFVREGRFLRDLLDRFGFYVIRLAPLRERREEILPLFDRFLEQESRRLARPDTPRVSQRVRRLLLRAPWPGNVRDLVKLAEYIAGNVEGVADLADLPAALLDAAGQVSRAPGEPLAFRAQRLVEDCGGNKSEAARRLGTSRAQLHRLLRATRA